MCEDYSSIDWADHHSALSSAIARAVDKLAYAFKRLNAIQYDAPWRCKHW